MCVCACVRACVSACMRVCVCVRVCFVKCTYIPDTILKLLYAQIHSSSTTQHIYVALTTIISIM